MSKPQQGKQYTIVKGDTLWSIATRAYGNPMKWSKIYRANASVLKSNNADLIYPGEVVYIPPEEEVAAAKAEAKANRFASRPKGTFNLVIGDREIHVESGRFKRGVDLLVSSWTATIPWTPGKDPALDKLIKRDSFSPSELYLGPELVATGKLYGVEPHLSNSGSTKTLEFFSNTADLADTTMRPPYEFGDVTLKTLARELCESLGYSIVFDISPGARFDWVTAQKTETVGAFLQRLSAQRGALCSCDERSRVIFIRATTTGEPVDYLEEGRPGSTEFKAKFDGRKRFAVYRCVGESGDADDIVSVAKDPSVPGARQLTFTADDVDSANVKNSAEWKRSKSIADAYSVPFPVSDWYTSKGKLWAPNDLAMLKSPTLDLPTSTKMLARDVEYVIENGGRSATLGVVPPFTLAGKAPEAPWI
jgi:prophage tail gpP-like protein